MSRLGNALSKCNELECKLDTLRAHNRVLREALEFMIKQVDEFNDPLFMQDVAFDRRNYIFNTGVARKALTATKEK